MAEAAQADYESKLFTSHRMQPSRSARAALAQRARLEITVLGALLAHSPTASLLAAVAVAAVAVAALDE
jgi:hypothetical protein